MCHRGGSGKRPGLQPSAGSGSLSPCDPGLSRLPGGLSCTGRDLGTSISDYSSVLPPRCTSHPWGWPVSSEGSSLSPCSLLPGWGRGVGCGFQFRPQVPHSRRVAWTLADAKRWGPTSTLCPCGFFPRTTLLMPWKEGSGFPNTPRVNNESSTSSGAFLVLFQVFQVMYSRRNLEITFMFVEE